MEGNCEVSVRLGLRIDQEGYRVRVIMTHNGVERETLWSVRRFLEESGLGMVLQVKAGLGKFVKD